MHGTAWLRAENQSLPPRLEAENSTFQFVREVRFQDPGSGLVRRAATSVGTSDWLSQQRQADVGRLWLVVRDQPTSPHPFDAHLAVAFANGGEWVIVATGPLDTVWTATWTVGDRDAPDRRIWDVQMNGQPSDVRIEPDAPDLDAARAGLMTALHQARDFADLNHFDSWAAWFTKALVIADESEPVIAYNPDLAPAGTLALRERQLLARAVQAWVFGGMGSWNDVWLDDQTQTRAMADITRQLYHAVFLQALVAVTNRRY